MTSDGIVIAIAGLTKSGKSTLASELSRALGWPVASFGDHVRAVAAARGFAPSPPTLAQIGAQLVAEECEAFSNAVLNLAGWRPGRAAILDGLRHLKVLQTITNLIAPQPIKVLVIAATRTARHHRWQVASESVPLDYLDSHSTSTDYLELKRSADLIVDGDQEVARSLSLALERVRDWQALQGT